MGKGDRPRPKSITREEEDLRWKLAKKHISFATFGKRYCELKRRGLIQRDGIVLK